VPTFPPITVKVVEFPLQIVVVPVILVGATELEHEGLKASNIAPLRSAIDKVTAPFPVAPIAGQAGEWQIVAPGAPEGDPFEWLNVVSDAAHVALGFAKSEADVMAIFKKNKVLFDTVKEVDPEAFKLIMAQFTEIKSKFTGA
jgi:hypothetical protein